MDYLNRELSWLEFNHRVLLEASNSEHPLLEQVRFLSISDKNLDEFYMVRVAGLKRKIWSNSKKKSIDGLSAQQQLERIRKRVATMFELQFASWQKLEKDLAKEKIYIFGDLGALNDHELEWLNSYFHEQVFPLLTPFYLNEDQSLPLLPNDSFTLVFKLKKDKHEINAVVTQPKKLPRFINLEARDRVFIPLEVLVSHYIDELFPGFQIDDQALFHIIKDGDIKIDSDLEIDDDEELLDFYRDAVRQRKYGDVIRLFTNKTTSTELLDFVTKKLDLDPEDIFCLDGLLNYSELDELTKIKRPDLLYEKYQPRFPPRVESHSLDYFASIRAKDIILHHPYESYDPVIGFLGQAAADDDVIAIKQTLYRTNSHSPIVKALILAAAKGKEVTAVIELKARFDEEANLKLFEALDIAGVQVSYGFVKMKTHSKISSVVRRENGENKIYTHIGTGNYNPDTARVYTDLSLFTCDDDVGKDSLKIFNYLTSSAEPKGLKKLYITPINMEQKLVELIKQEIDNAKAGKPAQIWAKMNSLQDPYMVDRLYAASQAGVKIDLIIRGICVLKAGIEGLSENITVKSIVGRFLEHSRIFCFANGQELPSAQARVFISSSDWMQRSFMRRVELMVELENKTVSTQVCREVMQKSFEDVDQSWLLQSDGLYQKADGQSFSAQKYFMEHQSLSGVSTD